MIDSTGSGHVGHERAARSPELVVEPDAGREGQDPGSDAGAQALGSARAVAFEAQDVLEGPKDRLDALADPAQARPRVLGLVLAGGSHDVATQLGHRPLEGAAGIALVADDRLAAAKHMGQQIEGDRALLAVGPDELSPARGAVGSAAQVQAHPPEEAAVAAAPAVAGPVAKGRAARGLQRAAALDRGRVEQHHLVVVAGAGGGEDARQPVDLLAQAVAALEVRRLTGQAGKQMRQSAYLKRRNGLRE